MSEPRGPAEPEREAPENGGEPGFEREVERLERRFQEGLDDLRRLRSRLREADRRLAARTRAELDEIREGWDSLRNPWWIAFLALCVVFLFAAYGFYMNLGWYADQRAMPPSSDWLLDRLPPWNLIPLLSWGWLALHAYGVGAAVLYQPRRLPFLFFLLGVYLSVRTLFVFLSPIGAPLQMLDMGELDALFPLVAGVYTFENEFIFSGHTAMPFLFALFLEGRVPRTVMALGSIAMAGAVLLTHNHYTVDVLSAYFMGYAIYRLAAWAYTGLARWFAAAPGVRVFAWSCPRSSGPDECSRASGTGH